MKGNNMKNRKKIFIPLGAILISTLIMVVLTNSKPDVAKKAPEVTKPLIRTVVARKQQVQVKVKSQGAVMPRTESTLVSQVAGQVIKVGRNFAAGGFFNKNKTLVSIDQRDYELVLIQSKSQVAQAELRRNIEKEEGQIARQEWEKLGKGDAPDLVARRPQLLEAEAALAAATARMEQARLNLERTKIVAPFTGRIRKKHVDVGQFVNPGTPVATVYAIDYVEIRLPLPDGELAFLDIPMGFANAGTGKRGPKVTLQAEFAGESHQWQGYIDRIEGEIDARSRMVHVVARVEKPYSQQGDAERPPLAVGMFVKANIHGHQLEDVFILPRAALRENNRVYVVDARQTLRFRDVTVVRYIGDNIIVNAGIQDGERLCISTLDAVIDGMAVRLAASEEGDAR